jgi:hypothetical protein
MLPDGSVKLTRIWSCGAQPEPEMVTDWPGRTRVGLTVTVPSAKAVSWTPTATAMARTVATTI